MSDPELKPCPHCGGEGEVGWHSTARGLELYTVCCTHCCARSGDYESRTEAIAAWNRRAGPKGEVVAEGWIYPASANLWTPKFTEMRVFQDPPVPLAIPVALYRIDREAEDE